MPSIIKYDLKLVIWFRIEVPACGAYYLVLRRRIITLYTCVCMHNMW